MKIAEQYRESQRELFAENEQLKAEISRLKAELDEAHEAGKLSSSAGVSLNHGDLLATIASRDKEIERLKADIGELTAVYNELLDTAEKAVYEAFLVMAAT